MFDIVFHNFTVGTFINSSLGSDNYSVLITSISDLLHLQH